jgi:hypothetical protein
MSLKTINVGLGGMLGEDALRALPVICPMLETIILYFQVIIYFPCGLEVLFGR